jgi:hypothetical protein
MVNREARRKLTLLLLLLLPRLGLLVVTGIHIYSNIDEDYVVAELTTLEENLGKVPRQAVDLCPRPAPRWLTFLHVHLRPVGLCPMRLSNLYNSHPRCRCARMHYRSMPYDLRKWCNRMRLRKTCSSYILLSSDGIKFEKNRISRSCPFRVKWNHSSLADFVRRRQNPQDPSKKLWPDDL